MLAWRTLLLSEPSVVHALKVVSREFKATGLCHVVSLEATTQRGRQLRGSVQCLALALSEAGVQRKFGQTVIRTASLTEKLTSVEYFVGETENY